MDIERVVRATAASLFQLYRMQFALVEPAEEARISAGAAIENYVLDCGLEFNAAIRIRDEIMLGIDPY
jgi:hypothetical protein